MLCVDHSHPSVNSYNYVVSLIAGVQVDVTRRIFSILAHILLSCSKFDRGDRYMLYGAYQTF